MGKNTAVFHKDIIKHIEKFSKTSAIQIHADVLKTSLEHLDADNDPDISVVDSVETIHVYGCCEDCKKEVQNPDNE